MDNTERKALQASFARVIFSITAQPVETTLIDDTRLSVYGPVNAVLAAKDFLAGVPSMTCIETVVYADDNEACAFYRY